MCLAEDVTGTAPMQVVNEAISLLGGSFMASLMEHCGQVLRPLGTGAFHAAVEVHGRCWCRVVANAALSWAVFALLGPCLCNAGNGAMDRQPEATGSSRTSLLLVSSTRTVRQSCRRAVEAVTFAEGDMG